MKKTIILSILVLLTGLSLTVLPSCEREPIEYATSNYYLELAQDSLGVALPAGSLWQVIFYDPQTKAKVYETFLTPNLHPEGFPAGGFVTGISAGEYDLVAFNFDTGVTTFSYGDASDRLYAYAPTAGYSGSTPVVREPDDLFIWSGRVFLPYVTEGEPYIIETHPKPLLKSYDIAVGGIKGLDIAESISIFISRQDRGSWMCPVAPLEENVILMAPGEIRHVSTPTKAADSLMIWTPILTFGEVAEGSGQPVIVTVVITGPNGSYYHGQADITDQVEAGEKVIIVNMDFSVEPMTEGGFDPEAKPWDVIVTQIELN